MIEIYMPPYQSFHPHNHRGVLKVHQFLGRGRLHLLGYIILYLSSWWGGGGADVGRGGFSQGFLEAVCTPPSPPPREFLRVESLWARNSVGWVDLLISVCELCCLCVRPTWFVPRDRTLNFSPVIQFYIFCLLAWTSVANLAEKVREPYLPVAGRYSF